MAMPMRFSKTFTDWEKMPVLLSLEDACCLLRRADVTVVNYIKKGYIKGNKIGSGWMIDRDSVREYFQKQMLG